MRLTSFIYFLVLIYRPDQSFAAVHNPTSLDTSTSGNYIINNCQRVHHSNDVHQLLARFRQSLPPILSDVEKGTSSSHGFRTFFKSNTNRPIVKNVFRAMLQGQNLTNGERPVIECLSPESMTGDLMPAYRAICTPPRRPPRHAVCLPPEGAIGLCPKFWEEAEFPTIEDCPSVVGRRGAKRFADSGSSLRDTRFAILIHELTHLYNPLDAATKRREVYDAQGCVDLDKSESVANVQNWALYATCELSPLFVQHRFFQRVHYLECTPSITPCFLEEGV
ncbi:MAG: hypothetical protein Q9168_005263 [Polycauliona sp. 1 TL-2023]